MDKDRRSFSLDSDVAAELARRDELNASAIVNQFLREYIQNGRSADVALSIKREQLQRQLSDKRAELSRLKSTIERLETDLEDVEGRIKSRRQEEDERISEVVTWVREHFNGDLGPDNPAIKNKAAQIGMTPERLTEEIQTRL